MVMEMAQLSRRFGASAALSGRIPLPSDFCQASVCGQRASIRRPRDCGDCTSKENTKILHMPFACKLLFHQRASTRTAAHSRS
jgi:hypothetical protein